MNPSKSAKGFEKEVLILADSTELKGILGVLPQPSGVVLFAHGSGSGRLSPRNNFVARFLQNTGIATLLVDLLEESEASDREKVFDIDLLAKRLLTCAHWLRQQLETRGLSLGYCCPKEFIIVPRASHLFEEKGALEKVAELALDWFLKHFLPQA